MTFVRITLLTSFFALLAGFGLLHAQPGKDDAKKADNPPAFQPVVIDDQLNKSDGRDPKLKHPSRKYAVGFTKDKTYIIDLVSADFDTYLRLLSRGKQVAEDDDSGGNLNALIVYSAKETGMHDVVVTTYDGEVGRFTLKIREYTVKGEAKPREVGAGGLVIADSINMADRSNLGKLARRYSIAVKAGKTYTIDMTSDDLDCYLYLFDNYSRLIAQNFDTTGDELNARIVFRAQSDSVIHVITTSFEGEDTGRFTLKVHQSD